MRLCYGLGGLDLTLELAGPLTGNTLLASQIASATSAMVWIMLSWRSKTEKPSITAVITGAIAGLAGVTPASGFISAQGAFLALQ